MVRMSPDLLFDLQLPKRFWKPLVKWYVTGKSNGLLMREGEVQYPDHLKRLGLYLHVPFCRSLCPYCPYNRVKYTETLYRAYENAVHEEIDLHGRRTSDAIAGNGRRRPDVGTLYIGGGTPTVEPASLVRMIDHIQEVFGTAGDVAVELHPLAMDDACLDLLKSAGTTAVSIGVESLSDRLLGIIGRSHDAEAALDAVRRAVNAGFDSVSVDLMFALPTQTLEDLDWDLEGVLELGADQVSAYPIFGFPYTELGRRAGIRGIKRPPGYLIRSMLDLIRERSIEHGLQQCAVWSYKRPGRKKFSSVTRHHYLGLGPSAASMTGRQFYVNTFSVEEYVSSLPDRLPVALVLPVDRRLEMDFWLYWRVYEMEIRSEGFRDMFGRELEDVYGRVLKSMELLGILQRNGEGYRVTDDGAYWIHRVQNEYALNYINRLWGRCREEAWPGEVRL